MGAKHTPTPYIASSNLICALQGRGLHRKDRFTAFVRAGQNCSEEEAKATAAFIARACNAHDVMLSALKECREELYHLAHPSGDPSDPTNMQSDAMAYRRVVDAIVLAEASA